MINFFWKKFSSLTVHELYEILSLRAEVFVVEQKCIYQDADGKDEIAIHLIGIENNKLVTYLRLFPPTKNNPIIFGRVIVAKSARQKSYGKKLIEEMLNFCDKHFPQTKIKCSAQLYLKKFYEEFGFKIVGDSYLEDDIPHIEMQK